MLPVPALGRTPTDIQMNIENRRSLLRPSERLQSQTSAQVERYTTLENVVSFLPATHQLDWLRTGSVALNNQGTLFVTREDLSAPIPLPADAPPFTKVSMAQGGVFLLDENGGVWRLTAAAHS